MKLKLKEFQEDAVDKLVASLHLAQREATISPQAVVLSAPTGSGKTAIAAAAIERMIFGDEEYPADDKASFVWLSDQPELNEQTRRKILESSSALDVGSLVVVGPEFDQEYWSPGRIHFLNTQKLGKDKQLVTTGDQRTFTIWETVSNTIRVTPGHFFVFIDEAHRGMAVSPREAKEANSIVQKFILGQPGETPPVPLIVGISATPERFRKMVLATNNRTHRPVTVPAEAVRASGLLKDVIRFFHPEPSQAADITMLSAATAYWKNFSQRWEKYCIAQNESIVRPVLVVQVQDGDSKNISRTDLIELIDTVNSVVGPLPDSAFAHSFQEGTELQFGPHKIRYLRPPDIISDYDVKIVLFKTSLNTGWDCPRAEVMMSFRKAVDSTLIAQLVGRMVRTPLARRIDADEFLNSVALYLPHYDAGGLKKVVDRLTTPDPDVLPPVPIERNEDLVTLARRKDSGKIFEELSALPSYVIPRIRKITGVRRLMKLSRLLANDDIRASAVEDASGKLLRILQEEYEQAKVTANFQLIVRSKSKVRIRAMDWQMGGALTKSETIELDIAKGNLDDLFEIAGRKFGEGLHKAWWRDRVEIEKVGVETAKLEIVALCVTPGVLDRVEQVAQSTVREWLDEYRQKLNKLPDAPRQAYDEIRQLATDPELNQVVYPEAIDVKKGITLLDKHVYVDDKEQFPAVMNGWENKVITKELEDKKVVGWLRNFDRKEWSLSIPYEDSAGRIRAFYPDFLIVRSNEDGLVVDLIEPHQIDLADAPFKARGLAKYAEKHGNQFDRIEFVTVKDARIRRLDMTKEDLRERIKAVSTREHLEQLFQREAGLELQKKRSSVQ